MIRSMHYWSVRYLHSGGVSVLELVAREQGHRSSAEVWVRSVARDSSSFPNQYHVRRSLAYMRGQGQQADVCLRYIYSIFATISFVRGTVHKSIPTPANQHSAPFET